MKKIIAMLLAVLMVASVFSGCGKQNSPATTTAPTQSSGNQQTAAPADPTAPAEKPTIVFSFPVLMFTPTEEGTVAVEAAINEYLDGIGESFHVDLDPIDGMNYANQVDMNLLGGTQMDVFCPFSGLGQAISGNKLLSLNQFLGNELKGAVDVMGERMLTYSTVDGECYAIPCYKGMILLDYWVVRKDVMDAAGLDPYATYTMDDITEALAKIQAVEPSIPAICARSAVGIGNSLLIEVYDKGVGNSEVTDITCGAAIIGQNTKVVNYYASEEFRKVVDIAYAWNQAGYVPEDSSLNTETLDIQNDQMLSCFIAYGYDRAAVEEGSADKAHPCYAIPIAEQIFTSNFISWGISQKSAYPTEAARFLNMLYTDETLLNLIIFGIEGEDYVVTDDTGVVKAINWPECKDPTTVPYTAFLSCGILGNQFIMHAMKGSTNVSDVPFMAEKMENATYSPIFGFSYQTGNVENQISACTNVISQYVPGLLCGELDPDQYIPILLADMEAAGINDIVADAQTQIDAWIAEQK